ncbi:hypothetical protein JBM62_000756 [Campylobacter jejuni]|nr:hypothetical protein [Campylobacter jejuni]EIO4180058.1 hypothetical protein [Campylobacter coli]EHO7088561.1 hypothetical protein [Campylobacter jejuni]EIX0381738.1 hypothetical protein [Campylobacter coli]EJL4448856.1 hypothetical protein [Campylobacter coli]
MSFTDLYFDREEKRISNYTRELVKDELESRENFADIFNSLQEFKNILEASLEDDEDIAASLQAYGDEFINDTYDLLEKVRKFEKKYEKLY